ncbi:hypothetical protein [Streptomyces blattellae]|uniref:hypothetical protein n=1 Tax=Streptomyces blattellae TaxID=2569855 RepID=UPI0012BA053B|nr:hypothetical protein [Streptomyces blattellae]
MSDESRADDAHQPTGSNEEQEDAAPLDLQDAVDERTYDDMLDEGYSPPEKPTGVTKAGTTAAEQHAGESLDERLAQEVPEAPVPDEDARTDTTGEPGSETEGTGTEGTGTEGTGNASAGAEEAAVHVVPDERLPPAGEGGE